VNAELLYLLRSHASTYVPVAELSRRLGLPVERVQAELDELERFGFGLERVPHTGVRYLHPARRLCPDQIEWRLNTRQIGRSIAVWYRVGSTNDVAADASHTPSNHGLVVLAEHQTAGRGRLGSRWVAPPETAILMSVLLFPPPRARSLGLLTALGAVAVAELIREELALTAVIKWPNDVLVGGRKVCGVLVEELARRARRALKASPNGQRLARTQAALPAARPVVIGIGLNVNLPAAEFPPELAGSATSLMALCGRALDRSELARSLIRRLDQLYCNAIEQGDQAVVGRWEALRCS